MTVNKTFSTIFLEPGYKVLIAHRRLFEMDRPRLFVGIVDVFNENNGLLKVTGYSFSQSLKDKIYFKKQQPRTKLVSLITGMLIVYELPSSVEISELDLRTDPKGTLVLSDKHSFQMDLSE